MPTRPHLGLPVMSLTEIEGELVMGAFDGLSGAERQSAMKAIAGARIEPAVVHRLLDVRSSARGRTPGPPRATTGDARQAAVPRILPRVPPMTPTGVPLASDPAICGVPTNASELVSARTAPAILRSEDRHRSFDRHRALRYCLCAAANNVGDLGVPRFLLSIRRKTRRLCWIITIEYSRDEAKSVHRLKRAAG